MAIVFKSRMKRVVVLIISAVLLMAALAGQYGLSQAHETSAVSPPESVASYDIQVSYDPETHTLIAQEQATYINLTTEPIEDVVMHMYLNAFSSTDTLWMREGGASHRMFSMDENALGSIRIDDAQIQGGSPLTFEPVDTDGTLMRAELPEPIGQGQSVVIEMEYTAVLPWVFARTGFAGEGKLAFIMVGQWYPKFGVWEDGAWNAYPFHANSEFYADFGTYDVEITLPKDWTLGATGVEIMEPFYNDDGTIIHTWHAENVIDFAWTAAPFFKEKTLEVDGVTVRFLYPPDRKDDAQRVIKATTGALVYYTDVYGPYGQGLFEQLTVVVVPEYGAGAGGMEYPTLFTVGANDLPGLPRCVQLLEIETVHELGHQWFQSMVATNEAEEPWLDEGFTDYSATRAMQALYDGAVLDCGGWRWSYAGMSRMEYHLITGMETLDPDTAGADVLSQFGAGEPLPMAGRAWDFGGEYSLATYAKPVIAFNSLQRIVGEEAMDTFLRTYVDTWAFDHPNADDVYAVMVETLGQGTADWFFDELVYGAGTLNFRIMEHENGSISLSREGGLCYPIEVEVVLEKGDKPETLTWDCDGEQVMTWDSMPWSVIVDPQNKLLFDQNLADDDLLANPDNAAWFGLTSRWMYWLQVLFSGGLW